MREIFFLTPEQAEEAFYRAFQTLDLTLMEQVWSTAPQVACVHPGGDLLLGVPAVLDSWRRIMHGAKPPTVTFRRLQVQEDEGTRVHLVEEWIRPTGEAGTDATRVIATNVYRRHDGGWLLQLHHASLPVVRAKRATDDEEPQRLH